MFSKTDIEADSVGLENHPSLRFSGGKFARGGITDDLVS